MTTLQYRVLGRRRHDSINLGEHLLVTYILPIDLELIKLDLDLLLEGGLNRESLLAAYDRALSTHHNIRLVILGKL